MTGHVRIERAYTGRYWMVFWTLPLCFCVWKRINEPEEFTREAMVAFRDEQITKIRQIPRRLWSPAWNRTNEEKANELREYA